MSETTNITMLTVKPVIARRLNILTLKFSPGEKNMSAIFLSMAAPIDGILSRIRKANTVLRRMFTCAQLYCTRNCFATVSAKECPRETLYWHAVSHMICRILFFNHEICVCAHLTQTRYAREFDSLILEKVVAGIDLPAFFVSNFLIYLVVIGGNSLDSMI